MSSHRRRVALVSLLAAIGVGAGGCYPNSNPTDYGALAKKNFVASCSTEVRASKGTTTTIRIESTDTCECIYDAIVNKFRLPWDDLVAYENEAADAEAGDAPPTPPKQLTKAIESCNASGPVAP